MTQTFNIEPYYDDYDKHKHFHKILFRPGYSLQTRELTQMQTILQNQIANLGDHLFKNGTMVIPGNLSFDNTLHYVTLNSTFNSTAVSSYLSNLAGAIVKGGTSGIRAQVISASVSDGTDPNTLFIKYLDGGTSGFSSVFADNESIAPEDVALTGMNVQSTPTLSTGMSSSASVGEGVYYVNGYFVLCESQTIILDKYTNTPTYSIGFNIVEKLVTPENDETLLDNAQGSYNFAAPGSHRYSIELILNKKTDINNSLDTDTYIQLTTLINGSVQTVINQTQYAELAKTMARRTYDESGDYVVNDFLFSVKEHRNNNRGAWTANVAYIISDIVAHSGLNYVAETAGTSGSGTGTWTLDELTTFNDGGVVWRYASSPNYNLGVYTPAQGGLENSIALAIEPGKAYVKGYEIEKVGTTFLTIPKARTSVVNPLGVSNAIVGNYVLVTNIHSIPDLSVMPSVDFYSGMTSTGGSHSTAGAKIGSGFVRYFELDSGTPGTATAVYKLGLFNNSITAGLDFSRVVKQFYVNTGSTLTSFTADISPVYTTQAGTVTVVASTGVVTGTGTNFNTLQLNDVVNIGGKRVRVSVITSSSLMTVVASPDAPVDVTVGLTYDLATTAIISPDASNLIFGVRNFTKNIRDTGGLNQLRYSTYQVFSGTTDAGGNISFNMTVTAGNGNIFGSTYTISAYAGTYGNGVIAALNNTNVTLSNSNKTCSIAFGVGAVSTAVKVIALVEKVGSIETEKTKTLTYASKIVTTAAEGTSRVISLGKADGFKVYSIKMDGGTYATPNGVYSIDITNRYAFNNGQTDSYYGISSIVLGDGQNAPIAPFKIIYSYFNHASTGDYFTLHSYNVSYDQIPFYGNYPLSDCIDFRPRINDAGTAFSGTGSSAAGLPKLGIGLKYQYEYYVSRIDKLCLEPDGTFNQISGVAASNAKEPASSSTGMLLNVISLGAYTLSKANVDVKTINNKRYTMRDIGRLDDRISNLEYYTTLSLVEQDTSSLSVTDTNGLNRYKNGFIVDGFNGQGIGDINAVDYSCSVDAMNKSLRPYHVMKNVQLYETGTNNRVANNYMMTGDLITLPYIHSAYVTQPFASRSEFVNPYSVFTFYGNCSLNPQSDDWLETERAPDKTFQAEGVLQGTGVLGTLWGTWNSIWSGVVTTVQSVSTTPITTSKTQLMNGEGFYQNADGTWPEHAWDHHTIVGTSTTTTTNINVISTATTSATQTNQSRVGVTTSIQPVVNTSYNGDIMLSRTDIPYMRSRNIAYLTQGLKSNKVMYATFDGTDVNAYVTPATILKLNTINGFVNSYDYTTNAGDSASHPARVIGNSLDLALNSGMIMTGQTSGATAVILYQEPPASAQTFVNIHVANIRGTFTIGEIIIGSINGLTVGPKGTLAATPSVKVLGGQILTNYAGVACGIFNIPSSNALHFRTGDRDLVLQDTNTTTLSSTTSTSTYHATGIHEIWQNQYTATRNQIYVQTAVSGNRTLLSAGTTSVATTQAVTSKSSAVVPWDPLAQTFLVSQPSGMFVTKVDLFFAAKEVKLGTPVHIEIREVVNGFPANITAPFSQVYKDPNDVNVSTNGNIATTFTFPAPVYLESGKEYALVILSDSNVYSLFISQMGEVDIITGKNISSQPALGVLFKSSNGSTWTPDQLQDLKFTLYRAKFDTTVTGVATFADDTTSTVSLGTDPIHTTAGSYKIRVAHIDHQMPVGSKVTITGSTSVGGIANTVINGDHVISNISLDSYVITLSAAATSTFVGGGASIFATENIQFDLAHVSVSELTFPNTHIDHQVKFTTGQSVNGVETPYVKDASFAPFTPNRDVILANPAMIPSTINKTYLMAGAKAMEMNAILTSSDDAVSPVVDVQRISSILVSNKINNPTLANTNVNEIDDRVVVIGANKFGFDAVTNSLYTALTNTVEVAALSTCTAGKYINIASSGSTANSGDMLVVGTTSDVTYMRLIMDPARTIVTEAVTANTVTVVQHQRFIDEICPLYGTAYNKYISKEIILANPSTYLKVKLSTLFPVNSDVVFYYRTNPVGGALSISNYNWIKAMPNSVVAHSNNFVDVDIDVESIASFDSLQIKIVMIGSSSSQVPMCQDLRIIACA